jgi:DNA-binding response OmpR family regulator
MGTTVLLVDDNSRLAWPLRQRLEQEGVDVSPVASAEEGVDRLRDGAFDVVVVGLPGAPGLRLCRALKMITPVVVCLLTRQASPGRIAEGFAAGADLVVGAPYDATELAARLRALLRRSHGHWEAASER